MDKCVYAWDCMNENIFIEVCTAYHLLGYDPFNVKDP